MKARASGTSPLLSDTELLEMESFAAELADVAASVIRPLFRAKLEIDNKTGGHDFDPVTRADRDAERAMRELIDSRYPEHGIVGEEYGRQDGSNHLTWVLDPIDGTRSFICGMPLWGVLVALNDGQRPILGLMEQPFTGERFSGSRLGAALQQGGDRRRLQVRQCANLSESTLLSTHPDLFQSRSEKRAFQSVSEQARLTRYGGDCYAYCMLAHGQVDLVIESGLQPYDIQALIPIIEGAGGIVTDWQGGPAWAGGRVLAAGDSRVHKAALTLLSSAPAI